MRELAKSFNSFSWAVSLLGAQQVLNLVRRPLGGAQSPSPSDLGPVTRVAEGQLGSTLKNAFEAGEQLQRSAIDLAFGVLTSPCRRTWCGSRPRRCAACSPAAFPPPPAAAAAKPAAGDRCRRRDETRMNGDGGHTTR